MATHKKRLEALEVIVNDIEEGMTKLFIQLQMLSEYLNSRGSSWQGSPSQSIMNNPLLGIERESGRVNSSQMSNRLQFPRYVDDNSTK